MIFSVLSILVQLIIDETFSSAPLTIMMLPLLAFFHRKIQIGDCGEASSSLSCMANGFF